VKGLLLVLLVATMALIALSVLRARQAENIPLTASATATAEPNVGKRMPIVIELFTSEGCSSCPPADALLAQLDQMSPVPGAEIIVLSEHVDYWNYIGWADPFSSPAFSARQQAYAEVFRLTGGRGDVYTPQMVVDGQFEFVGSHASRAREAITKAISLPKANVQITPLASAESGALTLRVEVRDLPPLSANDQAEVLLALTENNLASNVARGENSGRKLRHSGVTREIRALGKFAQSQKSFTAETSINIAPGWKRADLRALAFVQERAHRRILGATSYKLAEAH
jgi:hypothetical protein